MGRASPRRSVTRTARSRSLTPTCTWYPQISCSSTSSRYSSCIRLKRPRMVSSKSSSVASGAMPTDATASPKSAATARSSARRWTISLCSSCRVDVVAVFISTVLRWSSALKLLLGSRRSRRGAFGANGPRRRIEELELLLGPQRAGDRHDPGPYDPNVSGRWPFSRTGVASPRCPRPRSSTGRATGPSGVHRPDWIRAGIRHQDRNEVDRFRAGRPRRPASQRRFARPMS